MIRPVHVDEVEGWIKKISLALDIAQQRPLELLKEALERSGRDPGQVAAIEHAKQQAEAAAKTRAQAKKLLEGK